MEETLFYCLQCKEIVHRKYLLPLHWTSCEIQAALKQSPHSEARQLLQKYFGLGVLATLASFTRTRATETESGVCSEDERR